MIRQSLNLPHIATLLVKHDFIETALAGSGTHPAPDPAARHELRPLWPTIVCAADNPCDLAISLAFQRRHVRVLRVVEVGAPVAPGLEIGAGALNHTLTTPGHTGEVPDNRALSG